MYYKVHQSHQNIYEKIMGHSNDESYIVRKRSALEPYTIIQMNLKTWYSKKKRKG